MHIDWCYIYGLFIYHQTPLHNAAGQGDMNTVKSLVGTGDDSGVRVLKVVD